MKIEKNIIIKLLELIPIIVIISNLIFNFGIANMYEFAFIYYTLLMSCEINYSIDFKMICKKTFKIIVLLLFCNLLIQFNEHNILWCLLVSILMILCILIIAIILCNINYVVLSKERGRKYIISLIILLIAILLIIPNGIILISYGWRTIFVSICFCYLINMMFLLFKLKSNNEIKTICKVIFTYIVVAIFIYIDIFVLPRGLSYRYKEVDKIVVTYNTLNNDLDNVTTFEIENTKKLYNNIRFSKKVSNMDTTGFNIDPAYEIIIIYKNGEEDRLISKNNGNVVLVSNYYNGDYIMFYSEKILKQVNKEITMFTN